MSFNKSVSTCTILRNPIWQPSSVSCAMFEALFSWAFTSAPRRRWNLWFTLMLIGMAVQTLGGLLLVMLSFSVLTSSLGPPSARTRSRAPVPKLSTALLPMQLLKYPGYVSCGQSSMFLSPRPHWYIVTTSALFICPPILFSISVPSMWKLIFTSSEKRLPSMLFACYMSRRLPSLQTSSLRLAFTLTEFRTSLNVHSTDTNTAGGVLESVSRLSPGRYVGRPVWKCCH
jgi:hypothetical protein